MKPNLDLTGKVALVTGGGSGIGQGIARMFASLGASVAVADLDLSGAESTAHALEAEGHPALALEVDVQTADSVDAMVTRTIESLGGLDILVNSAGVGSESMIVDMLEEEWDWVLGVNLKGTFLCTRAAARWWIAQKRPGKIINLSSINETVPLAGEVHYCASKGGVMMFTRAAALELAPYRIHVNALAPGMIETPLTEEVTQIPELRRMHLKQVPFGRFGQPEDVARAAAFLASEWSDWVTGHTLFVDGGMHLVGEESYVWAMERAMRHDDSIPRVPLCWPPGALEDKAGDS
jgi:NAD(P)-dependent dehydrogenase (short-subunit alcohol dehydrogenase family)